MKDKNRWVWAVLLIFLVILCVWEYFSPPVKPVQRQHD